MTELADKIRDLFLAVRPFQTPGHKRVETVVAELQKRIRYCPEEILGIAGTEKSLFQRFMRPAELRQSKRKRRDRCHRFIGRIQSRAKSCSVEADPGIERVVKVRIGAPCRIVADMCQDLLRREQQSFDGRQSYARVVVVSSPRASGRIFLIASATR